MELPDHFWWGIFLSHAVDTSMHSPLTRQGWQVSFGVIPHEARGPVPAAWFFMAYRLALGSQVPAAGDQWKST